MSIERKRKKLATLQKNILKGVVQERQLNAEMKRTTRKMRTRKLIEVGGLLEKVGIIDLDREFLVGCFLGIQKIEVGGGSYDRFKESGRTFLNK